MCISLCELLLKKLILYNLSSKLYFFSQRKKMKILLITLILSTRGAKTKPENTSKLYLLRRKKSYYEHVYIYILSTSP